MAHPVSVRLDRDLVEELRRVSRRWSFERNDQISWCDVLTVAVRRFLAEEKAARRQGA
jgi:hypothetical protein